jgi:ComEC/Rec2-related protein
MATFALVHVWQWQENPSRPWAAALADPPRYVTVTGVLVEEPRAIPRGAGPSTLWQSRLRAETWTIDGENLRQPTLVAVRWASDTSPQYGDRWTVTGTVRRPPPARNPGQFDAAAWYARQNVFLELRSRDPEDAQLLARHEGPPVRAAATAARAWILHTLGLGLPADSETRAVIAGIALGAREEGSDELLPAFRQTGTLHLFAVSGLHVGMFGLLLWLVLRPLRVSRRQAILIIIPALFFYALITGAKPSSLRAATMISIALGGFLLDRPITAANSLAAAALVLLGWDTNQLFLPGFQLSFCVVSSILLLTPPLHRRMSDWLRPDPFLPRKLYTRRQRAQAQGGQAAAAALSVSTAAWLGSLPLTIAFFHLVPLVAVPANILAVPLAFGILAISMLSLAGGVLGAAIPLILNHVNWALASVLLAGVQGAAALPGAWVPVPPAWMQTAVRLTVFDLSTGGAQLLRTPQAAWLFDTGTVYDFERIIAPNLRAAGIAAPDALVITHGDTEHIGGARALLATGPPHRVLDSVLRDRSPARRTLHAALQETGIAKTLALPGDRFRAGPRTTIDILSPSPGQRARLADDQVLVTRLRTGPFTTLLMSDAGAVIENRLATKDPENLRADIVLFGRHGNDLFATAEFLAAVQPRAIILAPADPFRDGRDEPALRARLAATGAEIFDQETCGAVTIIFHPDRAEMRSFLDDRSVTLPPQTATPTPAP